MNNTNNLQVVFMLLFSALVNAFQFTNDEAEETSFIQMGGLGAGRTVLFFGGICLALAAVLVACKKFFKGCWRAVRCRKVCRPLLCCWRVCGKDEFEGFDLRVVIHNISENKRSSGKFQIRVVHDTKVYKSSESESGRWNETVNVKVQQGVPDIVLELWHFPVVGNIKKVAESYVDIKRDIIDRNYPMQALVQLRKRGMRDCMLNVSFERPDIVSDDVLASVKTPVSDELRYRVSKASHSMPASPHADPAINEIQALSHVLCGPIKTTRGVLGQMTHCYYAVVHDKNKPMHQGWYWARWQSLQAREAGEPPEKRMAITQIVEVKATKTNDEFAMIWSKDGEQKVQVFQSVDRSRTVWIEGLKIFVRKLYELTKRESRRASALNTIQEVGLGGNSTKAKRAGMIVPRRESRSLQSSPVNAPSMSPYNLPANSAKVSKGRDRMTISTYAGSPSTGTTRTTSSTKPSFHMSSKSRQSKK